MELKICHMYPDVLNLYGDRGNVMCMQKRLSWRGIENSVTRLPIGSNASLAGFDLVFIGGGQDFEQQVLLEDLHRGKDREILAAVADGLPFLTICGGYQMLGNYYETYDGVRCDFIGAVDLYTVGSKQRMIGNYKFRCGNVFGTYSHGPLLPKNPALCDHILLTALQRKYGKAELAPLDDAAELAAHDAMAAKIRDRV